jgi:hypothetical protein
VTGKIKKDEYGMGDSTRGTHIRRMSKNIKQEKMISFSNSSQESILSCIL